MWGVLSRAVSALAAFPALVSTDSDRAKIHEEGDPCFSLEDAAADMEHWIATDGLHLEYLAIDAAVSGASGSINGWVALAVIYGPDVTVNRISGDNATLVLISDCCWLHFRCA